MNMHSLFSHHQSEPPADAFSICMGDVAWNLMLIVLLASAFLVKPSETTVQDPDLRMAKTSHSAPVDEDQPAIIVAITSDGTVKMDDMVVGNVNEASTKLPPALRRLKSNTPSGPPLYVRIIPDKGTDYEFVVAIHDAVSEVIKADRIALMAEGNNSKEKP